MRVYLIIILIIRSIYIFGQQPNFQYFDDTNGLLDFEQYSLLEDNQKYIWIAGNSGIFKYNGSSFKTFRSENQINRALTNLRCDKFERVWCHDFSGNIYFVENNKLQLFQLWDKAFSTTFPIFEISDNKLWVIYDEGVNCYSIPKKMSDFKLLKSIKVPNSRSAHFFMGKLFISSSNNIISINNNLKITSYQIQGKHHNDFLKAWSSYYILDNALYLLSRQEKTLYKFNGNEFIKQAQFDFLPDIITCKNINNNIWILTRSGAYCFDRNYQLKKILFKNIPVSDILKDYENNYWFSTLTKGVFLVPNLNSIIYNGHNQQGFTKLVKHQGKLIAGGTDGNLYELIKDSLTAITNEKNSKEISFLKSAEKDLFFGNINFCKLTATGSVINLGINPPFKQLNLINENTALVADPSGLYYYSFNNWKDPDENIPKWAESLIINLQITRDNKIIRTNKSLLSERTNKFFANDKFILTASKNGTYLITSKQKILQNIDNKPIYSNDFTHNDSCVFVATSGLGVLMFKNLKWEKLNDLNTKIHNLYIQKIKLVNNEIWLATDEGIIKYNLHTKQHAHYGREEGLITNKINDLCDFNNKMFVATSKGLMTFPLTDIVRSRINPPVILSSVVCDGDTMSFANNLIKTEPNSRIISFQFDILAYNSPESYVLRYKRENSDFIDLSKQNYQIVLNQLNPGNNILLVELFDKQQNKIVYSKQFIIYVSYAFYQTWYFKAFSIIMVISIVSLFIKKRIKTINQKNKELIEKEKLLTELKQSMLTSIKAQMNPHFIFNALNTIQSYVLKNDKMQANFYLGKFSDLIRKILQMSNKESVSLREEIEALELYLELENMRLNNELKFSIQNNEIIDLLSKKIPSMIIQPYVENAIKHGLLHKKENKCLEINFHPFDNNLKVTIIDNGIGREAAEKIKHRNPVLHQSFSSDANKKRLELLNAQNKHLIAVNYDDLYDSNLHPIGTKVTIHIPLS